MRWCVVQALILWEFGEGSLLICWASGSVFTQLKVLQGKHQRVSKSDSVIVRLPKFRCLFELFEVSLLPCSPSRLFPTLPLFSWPAFTSLPKSKLLPLTNIIFFSLQASPYLISSKQLTENPLDFGDTGLGEIWLSVSQSALLCYYLSSGFALPYASLDALLSQRKSRAQSWGQLT